MQTEKLYYQEPYLREFTANILSKTALPDGRYAVVLDRTAFYPEGGGQPCDLGALNDAPVLDVRTEAGSIIHTTEKDPGDSAVTGRIDWRRRFDHMQQHTGEHILSGILLTNLKAENVGFHLSSATCQIDVTLPALSPEQALAIEEAANAVVFANLPVEGRFVEIAELPKYSLRKAPGKEFDRIRLVSVKDCDCCPCGGTHVASTGEVGLIKLRGWEKRKNNIRLDFVSGLRALADYRIKHELCRTLSTRFSTPTDGILAAVERTGDKLDASQGDLSSVRKAYHEELAARLLKENELTGKFRIITQVFNGYGMADLQDFAARITNASGGICLTASSDSGNLRASFLFSSAETAPISMSDLLKTSLAPCGGKGGGNALQAQGGAPTSDPNAILSAAMTLLQQHLEKSS